MKKKTFFLVFGSSKLCWENYVKKLTPNSGFIISEFTKHDDKLHARDGRDRAITCVFCRDLH